MVKHPKLSPNEKKVLKFLRQSKQAQPKFFIIEELKMKEYTVNFALHFLMKYGLIQKITNEKYRFKFYEVRKK